MKKILIILILGLILISGCGQKIEMDGEKIDIKETTKENNQNSGTDKVLETLNKFNIDYKFDQFIDKYGKKTQIMILDLRTSPLNNLPTYSEDTNESEKSKFGFIYQSFGFVFIPLYEKDKNAEYYKVTYYTSELLSETEKEPSVFEGKTKRVLVYSWTSTSINLQNLYNEIITPKNFILNLDGGLIGIDYE